MVTATSSNVLIFQGRSKRIYPVNAYISDVVGANVKMNVNGAAGTGSDSFWKAPEDVALIDASIITGPTVAVGMVLQADGATIPASAVLFAKQLDTLNRRLPLAVPFNKGTNIAAVQF